MKQNKAPLFLFLFFLAYLFACDNSKKPPAKALVHSPAELQQKAKDLIQELLVYAEKNNGGIGDSDSLNQLRQVQLLYKQNQNTALWSKEQQWQAIGDSLFYFISHAKSVGLFPEDYHYLPLVSIRTKFLQDSLAKSDKNDAALWARADLLLTDAFVKIVKDIKLGRLPDDSISLRKDSVLKDEFYQQQLDVLKKSGSLSRLIASLEPTHPGYYLLKAGLQHFLENFDSTVYTFVPPMSKDTARFRYLLQKRLYEGGYIETDSIPADSTRLAAAIKKFQQKNFLEVDGKAGMQTLRVINTTNRERFVQVAITLDRFKLLPPQMPDKFLWVNLPSFTLQLWEGDSITLVSKIICGKPITRSPVLTSAISELITYPKWTIPASIIEKEILPALKRNPGYLAKKGYGLFDAKGNEVNPDSIDWSKYKKTIPFNVIQGSGDANALGVLKFNFNNKYSVYLHDTNERQFFSRNDRALSHGCIRVQEWRDLANIIVRNDSLNGSKVNKLDSLQIWLRKKEKHSLSIRNKLPLFIRYFTCEGRDGKIIFYNDIYGEDKKLAEKYFPGK
jgi:murein L,D-transpeptidase YcbB/YkuD